MIVTEVTPNTYRVELTELELQAFMVIVAGMVDLDLSTVAEAISHILTYCSDRCFLTVKEPELNGSNLPRDGFGDG